jgi:hypothetical protein
MTELPFVSHVVVAVASLVALIVLTRITGMLRYIPNTRVGIVAPAVTAPRPAE